MTAQEKKEFLKKMGYYSGTPTPKRVVEKTESYRKSKKFCNIDKSELNNLYMLFNEKKAPCE